MFVLSLYDGGTAVAEGAHRAALTVAGPVAGRTTQTAPKGKFPIDVSRA